MSYSLKMVKPFPLYDLLKASTEKDTTPNHGALCAAINGASEDHAEFIYALIHHHELVSKSVVFERLPYGAKVLHGGRGVIFTANELPPVLLKILNGYINRK